MKKVTLLLFSIFTSTFSTFAISGEAIVPFWQANNFVSFTLNISNVSSTDAEVEVVFYNKDGSIYSGSYQTDNGGALNAPFTLPANETVWIWINGPSGTTVSTTSRGYAVIKSTEAQGQSGKSFLVAHGNYNGSGSDRFMAVPVNAGLPF